jgi:hypothetical protein
MSPTSKKREGERETYITYIHKYTYSQDTGEGKAQRGREGGMEGGREGGRERESE